MTSVWPGGQGSSMGRSTLTTMNGNGGVSTRQEERHEDTPSHGHDNREAEQLDVTEQPNIPPVVLGASAFHVDHTTADVGRMYHSNVTSVSASLDRTIRPGNNVSTTISMSSSSVPYSTERENALLTMAYKHLGRVAWSILPGNMGREPQLNSIHLVAPENNLYSGAVPVAELCIQVVGLVLTELCRTDVDPSAKEIFSELKTCLRAGYEGMSNYKALQEQLDDTMKTLGVNISGSSHSTLMQLHRCWVEASKLGLGEGHATSYGKRPASQLDQQLHWYCSSKAMKKLTKILNHWLNGEHTKVGYYFIAECIRALHIGTACPYN